MQKKIIAIAVITIFVIALLYFYRTPTISRYNFEQNKLYSPAYGKVETILHNKEKNLIRISIFLDINDIHSQYYPSNGMLLSRQTIPGKYEIATQNSNTVNNARTITKIVTPYQDIVTIEQVSGLIARKISDGGQKVGATVSVGEYLGRIHLGSRVNIIFSDDWEPTVAVGDIVRGPDSEIAKLRVN